MTFCTYPDCACPNEGISDKVACQASCAKPAESVNLAQQVLPSRDFIQDERLPVVMIPQYPTQWGRNGPERRALDLSDAERYGQLLELCRPVGKPWDPAVAEEIDSAMSESHADDWLLCIGNPTMIALAAASFASIHGHVNVLQFQSRKQSYEAIRYEFTDEGTEVTRLTLD